MTCSAGRRRRGVGDEEEDDGPAGSTAPSTSVQRFLTLRAKTEKVRGQGRRDERTDDVEEEHGGQFRGYPSCRRGNPWRRRRRRWGRKKGAARVPRGEALLIKEARGAAGEGAPPPRRRLWPRSRRRGKGEDEGER